MKVLLGFVAILAILPSEAGAQEAPLSHNAATMLLDFWQRVKAGEGAEVELISEDATFGIMGLGGEYDHYAFQIMKECELVAAWGSKPKSEDDQAEYVWGLIACEESGGKKAVPLGIGVLDDKITQIEIDIFSQMRLDPSSDDGAVEGED